MGWDEDTTSIAVIEAGGTHEEAEAARVVAEEAAG